MPSYQNERPQFFEGQYLGAEDLSESIDYGRIQMGRHALGAHTWGIATGLQIRDTNVSGNQVEPTILPGYAWDGFGRPIVLLAPYKVPAALFGSYVFDPVVDGGSPEGRLIPVWLRYNEVSTQNVRPGFEVCGTTNTDSRVQETFILEVGARPNATNQRDLISVAGALIDAETVIQQFDPQTPPVSLFDESVPFQDLPEDNPKARWLIPLGKVRWKPNSNPNLPGNFVKRSDDDLKESRSLRRYIGVVAESVQAADKVLRLRDRTKDYSKVQSDDLVWVEGDLRVEGNVRLFNHRLDFMDQNGLDNNGIPFAIRRNDNPGVSGSLQVVIGKGNPAPNTFNTFSIGPLDGTIDASPPAHFLPKLTVQDDGKVGIGTSIPSHILHVLAPDAANGAVGLFESTTTQAYLRLATSEGFDNRVEITNRPGGRLSLWTFNGGDAFNVTKDGNVGIGTINPTHKFHVLTPDAVGLFESTTTQAFLRLATIEGFDNRVEITNRPGGRLSLWTFNGGDAFNVTKDGNVGIGTINPTHKFHVLTPDAVGLFESTTTQAFLRLATIEGFDNRVEITNRPGGRLSLWTFNGGDAFNVTKDGNVGIGTINPTHKFHVLTPDAVGLFESTTTQAFLRLATSEGFDNRVEITNRPGGRLSLFTVGGGDAFNITRDGKVGIGTPTPGVALEVVGDLKISGTARRPGGGPWTNSSDVRLKKEVAPLADALGRLLHLRGVRFEWKEPEKMGNLTGPQMGLIAQEVEKVFPEWISTDPEGYKEITMRGFEALTVEALRELKAEIESLRKKMEKNDRKTAKAPRGTQKRV